MPTSTTARVSAEGLKLALATLDRLKLTQQALAQRVDLSRHPVNKFFSGKTVEQATFYKICDGLGLDPKAIMHVEEDQVIDILVQDIRGKVRLEIEQRCGSIRVLGMNKPVALENLYVDNLATEKALNSRKLIILGRPGVGKTTFLKHIGIKCIKGEIEPKLVPVFIPLRCCEDHADGDQIDFLDLIQKQWSEQGVVDKDAAEKVFTHGKALVLLDGLDEVAKRFSDQVAKAINSLSDRFPEIRMIISCRTSSRKYVFEPFTEEEIQEFKENHIKEFVEKWFSRPQREGDLKGKFLKALDDLFGGNSEKEVKNLPLLLTQLCLEFENRNELSNDRQSLYESSLDTLISTWDLQRTVTRDSSRFLSSVTHKKYLISEIAQKAFQEETDDHYNLTREQIERYIGGYVKQIKNEDEINSSSKSIIEKANLENEIEEIFHLLVSDYGLLNEETSGGYSFPTQDLQEYLVAWLAYKQGEEGRKILLSKIVDLSWYPIFPCYVELLPYKDIKEFLSKLQEETNNIKNPQIIVDILQKIEEQAKITKDWERGFNEIEHKESHIRLFYLERVMNLALGLDVVPTQCDSSGKQPKATVLSFYRNINCLMTRIRNLDPQSDFFSPNSLPKHNKSEVGAGIDVALYPKLIDELALPELIDRDMSRGKDRGYKLALSEEYGIYRILEYTSNLEKKIKGGQQDLFQKFQKQLESRPLPSFDSSEKEVKDWWQNGGREWTEGIKAELEEHYKFASFPALNVEEWQNLRNFYNAYSKLVECLRVWKRISEDAESQKEQGEIEDSLLKLPDDLVTTDIQQVAQGKKRFSRKA